jgi:hypothetical protein
MREESDRMDKREATILKAREVLERCGKHFKD